MFTFVSNKPQPKKVSSDILHYVTTATFPELRLHPSTPPLPAPLHKSHRNQLSVTIERNRILAQTQRIRSTSFDAAAIQFITKHIPSSPVVEDDVDPGTDDRPRLPAAGYIIDTLGFRAIKGIDQLGAVWISELVLATAQRVIQMSPEYQSTKDWGFTAPDVMQDIDSKLFRFFMWEKNVTAAGSSIQPDPDCSLIVAYQPPWILSPRDLDQFVQTKRIPKYNSEAGPYQERINSAQKVWIKLHEICKQRKCRTFVLTNYTEWVFGCFSPGWTYGAITNVKHARGSKKKELVCHKHKSNSNVLACLIFWILSSMGVPDHYELPPVPESIDVDMYNDENNDPSQRQVLEERPIINSYAPSESIWSGKSEEAPSSAGVQFDLDSEAGNTPPPFMDENWAAQEEPSGAVIRQFRTTVRQWANKNRPSKFMSPEPILPPPSPVMSEWSDISSATIRATHSQAFFSLSTCEEDVREYVYDNED